MIAVPGNMENTLAAQRSPDIRLRDIVMEAILHEGHSAEVHFRFTDA